MMKRLLFIIFYAMVLHPVQLLAQGESNIWTFATAASGNHWVIDFNTATPSVSSILPLVNDYSAYGGVVCYPNGQLRFIVRLRPSSWVTAPNIYLPNGLPVPNSNFLTGYMDEYCMPVIIPRPGNNDQYYIFYYYSNGLLYSLLDMTLNGGNGGIVPGQKDVLLGSYGTIVPKTIAAVKGCEGVWLVIRSRIANQYLGYSVTAEGINTTAVISEAGQFPLIDYRFTHTAFLSASPDGKKLAYTGWRGIELYDFETCSGKVKNAVVLDTTGNTPFTGQLTHTQIFNHARFQSLCFSPDNSKLYAVRNEVDSVNGCHTGVLYQYDMNQPTLAAILTSKTLVLANQPSIMENMMVCNLIVPNPLGEMKLQGDKLYIDNGSYTCLLPGTIPAGYNPGPGFHVINQPNLSGAACMPQFNAIVINNITGNLGGSFYEGTDGGWSYLPHDIVSAPPEPDTLPGYTIHQIACFQDSILLIADSLGSCYHWDDASTTKDRVVHNSGTYYVRYFKNCSYTTDTFHVRFIYPPVIIENNASCPGMHMGTLVATATDTGTLMYVWRQADGSILQQHTCNLSDTLQGLEPGNYSVTISSGSGCDTTLYAAVESLPQPDVIASPPAATIRYGDSITLHALGAARYVWWPTGDLDTATKADPVARPLTPTLFSVLGIGENGCRDTGFVSINIDYSMPDLVPNAFTPNGDGLNDVFKIAGITYQKVNRFSVYNRYGQEIFSTADGTKGWDGTQNGRPCDMGTYYYIIQLTYPNGEMKVLKGNLQLIR